MHENFDPKPLQNPERYDLLHRLGKFKLTLEAFQAQVRRSKIILIHFLGRVVLGDL